MAFIAPSSIDGWMSFTGLIDEARLTNRSLFSTEVKSIVLSGFDPTSNSTLDVSFSRPLTNDSFTSNDFSATGPQTLTFGEPVATGTNEFIVSLNNLTADGTYSILLDGRAYEVRVQPTLDVLRVHAGGREFSAQVLDPRAWRGKRGGVLELERRQQVSAPMPGKVERVLVKAGDAVEAGRGMLVVEAMKMQNEIRSPKKGKVEGLLVAEGQAVNAGDPLVIVA